MSEGGKLIGILQLFSAEKAALTAEDVAREIGVSISTAYRHLRALVQAGMLDQASGNYFLGPGIVALYRQLQLRDPVLTVARPIMIDLLATCGPGSTMILCRLFRDQVMCVHQEVHSGPQNPVGYEIGLPRPMFRGSASKVILANLSSRAQRKLYEQHAAACKEAGLGASLQEFRAKLKDIRKRPAYTTRGEVDSNRIGVAAALFAPDGTVIGSLSAVLDGATANDNHVRRVEIACATAAQVISSSGTDRAVGPDEVSSAWPESHQRTG